tara:strand:+ start:1424 stop:2983 length:1560 start_codon:yes stop_codon:yes gene_type:complete
MSVIDPNIFYKAGYSKAAKVGKQNLNKTINSIIGVVGKFALERYGSALTNLSNLRGKTRENIAGVNALVNDPGMQLKPEFRQALDTWQKDYRKGSRMVAMGLTSKAKLKGQELMDKAYSKMQNLHAEFIDLKERGAKYEKQGLLWRGEEVPEYEGAKWSSATSADELLNASELANGDIYKHMTVDVESGQITLIRDVSTEGDGSVITPIALSDLDWPEDEDDRIQGIQKSVIDEGIKNGGKGLIWDEMHGNYMKSEITNSINNTSQSAFKSYFFGGTASDFGSGKLQESSPAYMIMKEKFFNFNTGEWADGYEPGSEGYTGYLEHMKTNGDFSKGSQYRQKVVDLIYGASKAYHDNAYANWESKQKKNEGNRNRNRSYQGSDKILVLEQYKPKDQVDKRINNIRNNQPVWDWEGNKFEPKDGGYVDPGGNWYSKEDLMYGPYFGIGDRAVDLYPDMFSGSATERTTDENVEEVDEIPGEKKKKKKKSWYSKLFGTPSSSGTVDKYTEKDPTNRPIGPKY